MKEIFKQSPEQQQPFGQMKQEMVHEEALGPFWTGQDAKCAPTTAGVGEQSNLEQKSLGKNQRGLFDLGIQGGAGWGLAEHSPEQTSTNQGHGLDLLNSTTSTSTGQFWL